MSEAEPETLGEVLARHRVEQLGPWAAKCHACDDWTKGTIHDHHADLAVTFLAADRDARLVAVEALHIRRECLVYDDEECADGTCEHPTGTCVVLSPAVCAHCADQTEPGDGWEHLIREAAYWPCATTRALRSDPDEATCDGCVCPTEHDGDYGSAGHAGPCPPHTCGRQASTDA